MRSARFTPGEIVAGRYRLIRELGEGGMGVVWVAHSLPLGVDVAIKLIRSGVGDAETQSRMAREAQATATLGHPAIVRVFDFGNTERGDPYIAMELAHGETLGALLNRDQRIGAVQAVQLVLPIIDGLRCAHEHGIVHRDIKPENIFIARDKLGRVQPKLLDFGIAKLEQQPSAGRLTQVGEVLGSPEFMSPEQARGVGTVDLRTDVWSLCIMLYEMLTGTVPFKVTNYNALMQSILHEPAVPIIEYGAGDRELWGIVAKGLEKSRDKRWQSMTELGEALGFWLFDRGVSEDVAGNSLKAVWLGGSLAGVALDQSARSHSIMPGSGLPTLRLRLRRIRQKGLRGFYEHKQALLLGAGAVLLAIVVPIGMRYAEASPPAAAAAAVSPPVPREVVKAEPPPPAPPPSVAAVERATPLPTKPARNATAASASKHGSRPPARAVPLRQTATTRKAGPGSSSKSIRDFGF